MHHTAIRAGDYSAGMGWILLLSQVNALSDLLKPHTLRRSRAEISQSPAAKTEIQVPVSLNEQQADCYRKVLGRFYEALVDPKLHRLSSSRASQAKAICEELRKVRLPGMQI